MLKIKFFAFAALLVLASCRLHVQNNLRADNQANNVNSSVTYNESNLINTTKLGIPFAGEFRTGYIMVNTTTLSRYFYWLYAAGGANNSKASLNDTAPIILWMQGGPGCADGTGQFNEIGPYTIASVNGNLTAVPQAITWNDKYHLIFIDNPVGTGYSVGNESMFSSDTVAEYVQTFLIRLFQIYPNLGNQQVYVFAESYGGHYGPAVVKKLVSNATASGIKITGLGIVDGWVNPYYQATSYSEFAYAAGLIDPNTRDQMMAAEVKVKEAYFNQDHAGVANLWGNVTAFTDFLGIDVYNFRLYAEIGSPYQGWLNNNTIKNGLGVDNYIEYNDCIDTHGSFNVDLGTNYADHLEYILNSTSPVVKVLIMNGADDYIVNTAGVERYIRELRWPGAASWLSSSKVTWYKDKTAKDYVWGNWKRSGQFTFAVVNKAGHEIPMYTPDSARNLLERFVTDNWN